MANELTTTEAAELLGVTPRHVRWYHSQGFLVGRQIAGPSGRVLLLMFDRADVEAFEKPKKSGRPKGSGKKSNGKPAKKRKTKAT